MYSRHALQLKQELEVYQSLEFDPDNGIIFKIGVEPLGDDIKDFFNVPIEEMVEALSDDLRDAQDFVGLYCVAHEMNRLAEKLRERAMAMEDSLSGIGHLYEIDLSDMAELNEGLPE